MKVCMIVMNSVSHDARVLKEAEAVRSAGHDIVVIGIRDNKCSEPIEIRESGVVIRRVGWLSRAIRPWSWGLISQLLGIALAVTGIILLIPLIEPYLLIAKNFIFTNYLEICVSIVGTVCAYMIIKSFSSKQKRYKKVKRAERLENLKAFDIARKHLQNLREYNHTNTGSNECDEKYNRKITLFSFFDKILPRQLLPGFKKLFSASERRTWNSIYAREHAIYKVLEEEKPKIVHAHDLNALPVGVKYKKAGKSFLIFDAHECYDQLAQDDSGDLSALNEKLLRRYSKYVDKFITINESIAKYYARQYPSFPSAIIVKNATPIATDFIYDGRLHKAANIDERNKILLYQGGFAPKRGLENLLLSTEYISSEWHIVFMGWGALEGILRQIAASMSLTNPDAAKRIHFVPKVPQDELVLWTAGATLGVIPYENSGLNHWYCTPNKLWEYPNAGVPILASPFPELRKVVENNGIGFLLPDPLSPQGIGDVINSIDENELKQAAANCSLYIAKDNWNIYTQKLTALYQEVA